MMPAEPEPVPSNRAPTALVLASLIAAASEFLVGYNIGVMNPPEKVIFPGHSTAQWSLAVSIFAIGGPFGALVGGKMADMRGRRGALLINSWTFLVGSALQILASNMASLSVSRFIIGFASGSATVVVPIYLGEISPPSLRGALGTVSQFALVIGILAADLLAFPFATQKSWRVLFAVTFIVSLCQLLMSSFLLESPRWLLSKEKQSIPARDVIRKLRGLCDTADIENEVEQLLEIDPDQFLQEQGTNNNQWVILKEMMDDTKLRQLLLSCLVLHMAQQLSGINAVFYYSTSFFEGVIENPLLGTTIVGAVNVVATYGALLLMDSCGRKTLVLCSAFGMFASCIIIVLSLLGFVSNSLALVAVTVYVVFFEIGLGPIPWLIVAEMFVGKYVAAAMSLCCQLNWACNFLVGMIFPHMNQFLGPYSFVPFACVLGYTFIYTLAKLTETQGTTPYELIVVEKTNHCHHHEIELMTKDADKMTLDREINL